jgi:divalent metal cation (Fe/Co/Zn/Cd) transporter
MDAPLNAEAHRHGRRVHSHAHGGPHRHVTALRRSQPLHPRHRTRDRELPPIPDHRHGHDHDHEPGVGHGHAHGLLDESIKRSRAGIRAVGLSLGVLGVTAVAQTVVLAASGSLALLADVIHNFGDALTAVPLGLAFALRSQLAERRAGLMVVAAIFISACVVAWEAVNRLIHPAAPTHLALLAVAGAIGYVGNFLAARIRTTAGERLSSAALIADGNHARADAYVSLAVIASAALVAIGLPVADPILGLVITLVILGITRQSWSTVRDGRTSDTRR